MTRRDVGIVALTPLVCVVLLVSSAVVLSGCGGKKEEEAQPAPAPQPAPQPRRQVVIPRTPDPVRIDFVRQELDAVRRDPIAAQVEAPQSLAPISRSLAEALLSLGDAIARDDYGALGDMLNESDAERLQMLNPEGFEQPGVETVRLVALDGGSMTSESTEAVGVFAVKRAGRPASVYGFQGATLGSEWKFRVLRTSRETRPSAGAWEGLSLTDYLSDGLPEGMTLGTSGGGVPGVGIPAPEGEFSGRPSDLGGASDRDSNLDSSSDDASGSIVGSWTVDGATVKAAILAGISSLPEAQRAAAQAQLDSLDFASASLVVSSDMSAVSKVVLSSGPIPEIEERGMLVESGSGWELVLTNSLTGQEERSQLRLLDADRLEMTSEQLGATFTIVYQRQ